MNVQTFWSEMNWFTCEQWSCALARLVLLVQVLSLNRRVRSRIYALLHLRAHSLRVTVPSLLPKAEYSTLWRQVKRKIIGQLLQARLSYWRYTHNCIQVNQISHGRECVWMARRDFILKLNVWFVFGPNFAVVCIARKQIQRTGGIKTICKLFHYEKMIDSYWNPN